MGARVGYMVRGCQALSGSLSSSSKGGVTVSACALADDVTPGRKHCLRIYMSETASTTRSDSSHWLDQFWQSQPEHQRML